MEEPEVAQLATVFVRTLSSQSADELKQAEAFLAGASRNLNYGLTVLKLVAADAAPLEVRQAAAVNFKNHVKGHWQGKPADGLGGAGLPAMPADEKEQIKGLITSLMLRAPPPVRAQLSEALTIISSHDFPARWKTLLPELCERLGSLEPADVNGVLETANSIFKRYRNQFMTEGLSDELSYCQQAVKPLLAALQRITAALPATASDPTKLRLLLSSARLACRVFFSLNSPGLTEEFESTLDAWMAEFHTLLTFEAALPDSGDEEKETELDAVKSAVAANTNLFMEMNEEEFAKYLQTFVHDIWMLLTKVTLQPRQVMIAHGMIGQWNSTDNNFAGHCSIGLHELHECDSPRTIISMPFGFITGRAVPVQDSLAMNAIRFLTTVARSVHHKLFRNADALRQVCENIVIPNTRLREDLEEMFEFNWLEYVRRDTEGSDADTRRRAACELVRALTDKFPAEVTQLFTGYVGSMLQEYAAAPATNWKAKDCAVYLVTALAARGRTAAAGATATNELVNLGDFYRSQIASDLQSTDVNEAQVLKADALKFLTTFRSQIPKQDVLAAFPGIVRLLSSESNVVHSYAAICVERLLSLKDKGQLRFTVPDLQSQLQPLVHGLFGAFKMPESGENEYLMKCVMRLISFVGPQIAPIAADALTALAAMLLAVAKNPTQPGFNHFLFESVAALIQYSSAADAAMLDQLQHQLMPAFEFVLKEDVQEFHPYVFQIFAQLIELRQSGLSPVWMQVLPPLLLPHFWERAGNVPALVRLLQAYLEKAPGEFAAPERLGAVLGIFQKLVASKAHDHEGFYILNSITEHLPLDVLHPYWPEIWKLLFTRLQTAPTVKYKRALAVYLAFFVCKHGGATVADSIDTIPSAGRPVSVDFLDNVWAPILPSISGSTEKRLVAAASARLLTEVPKLREDSSAAVWGKLMQEALKTLTEQPAAASPDDEVIDVEEYAGYSAAFAQLHNAHKPDRDPLPQIPDAKAFFSKQLASLAAADPATLQRLVSGLPEDAKQALRGTGVSV